MKVPNPSIAAPYAPNLLPHTAPCVNSTIMAASISEMLQDSLLHLNQLSEVGVSQPFQNRHG
jgi:hypothetical protein